jgi:hypothetical protein
LIMTKICDHDYVLQRVHQLPETRDRKPLNRRWYGYDVQAVNRYWGAFDDTAHRSEKCFLKLDLAFPLCYGSAFLTSLLLAWGILGKPFPRAWFIAPVAITVVADWTENLIQLRQLQGFFDHGVNGLQQTWIQVASMATVIKLAFFYGTGLLLLGLIVRVIIQTRKSS